MADVPERFVETKSSRSPIIRAIGPGSTHASQTLYVRIGGEKVLDQIVDDVYKWMANDKDMGKQFARFRLERLKERTVDYLRGEWGGPDPYKGSDLWIAHSHIGIKTQWYDIMMKMFIKACKKAKLGKPETAEILGSIEKMRGPIVDANAKLKKIYLKYTDKLAEEAGGDGWGVVAGTPEERAAKEKATLALIAKAKADEMLREQKKLMDEQDAKEKAAELAAKKGKKDDDGASDSTKEPSSGGQSSGELATPKAKAKPKAKPKAKEPTKPPPDPAFNFRPFEDEAPLQLWASAPSGADLLSRLSVPCLGYDAL